MICLCGYSHEDWKDEAKENERYIGKRLGEEEFIEVEGTFLIKNSGWYCSTREVSLYACPECNTIQLSA